MKEASWIWCKKVRNGLTKTGRQKFLYIPVGRHVVYCADHSKPTEAVDSEPGHIWRYKNARFMPRWASRLTLELTGVRVERVNDISYDDAAAEGVRAWDGHRGCPGCIAGECAGSRRSPGRCETFMLGYKETFRALWDKINGPGAWKRNDWVWVLTFKRLEAQ